MTGELLPSGSLWFLVLALGLALAFEFVNGFHDTANAVATVIYTHALKPTQAVVWSGLWNLSGVLTSSGAIAFSIVALLPVDLVIHSGSAAGMAMVFALLVSAILWNLGTWYLGLPASSSHTMIGAILGVGLGHSIWTGGSLGSGVNWLKAKEVGLSLLISPLVGFTCAALVLLAARKVLTRPELYRPPEPGQPPPLWIRSILVFTCTGVSFAHGSNDGQKGMGLMMLILIGLLPGTYALDMNAPPAILAEIREISAAAQPVLPAPPSADSGTSQELLNRYLSNPSGIAVDGALRAALATRNRAIATALNGHTELSSLTSNERRALRTDILLVSDTIARIADRNAFASNAERDALLLLRRSLIRLTDFIPAWVKVAVALALGIGTMVGWRRIVVTVGEKIGKEHLTYAQGASAELVAMATIGASDLFGLPVSTTHVLSSGVAGTMAANGSGVQAGTVRNLVLAWVLTLPVCVLLGAATFAAGLFVMLNFLGMH